MCIHSTKIVERGSDYSDYTYVKQQKLLQQINPHPQIKWQSPLWEGNKKLCQNIIQQVRSVQVQFVHAKDIRKNRK